MIVTATVHASSLPTPLSGGVTMGHVAAAIAARCIDVGWGYVVTRATDAALYLEVTMRSSVIYAGGELLLRDWNEGPTYEVSPFNTVRQLILHALNEVTVALTPVAIGDTVTGA